MLKSSMWKEGIRETRFPVLALFLSVTGGIALLVAGVYGALNPFYGVLAIAAIVMVTVVILRQDELAALLVIATSICIDWYIGTSFGALVMALLLLAVFLLAKSPDFPWTKPRALWLWALFLGLTIFPAIQGATNRTDALYYYPDLICGALIMYWLGTVVARNINSIRRFFVVLSGFSTLIAIHLIIQATTGKFLFVTAKVQGYLDSISNYQLGTTGVSRVGSFFIQPDAGSAFLAVMFFVPLGLFIESSSLLKKVLYLIETLLILVALLFTYNTSAWLAAGIGAIVFVILVGSTRYRFLIPLYIIAVAVVLFIAFPSQVNTFLQHVSDSSELLLRRGLWETAWHIIQAFPLTGVGLGRAVYLQAAEPFRVPAQFVAENNPHNAYLEWGAMAGLPVLAVFLALISFALWQALRNWMRVDGRSRSLLAAGIAGIVTLSVNSWSFGVWTLPPLAACGWLVLGMVSSPLLAKKHSTK